MTLSLNQGLASSTGTTREHAVDEGEACLETGDAPLV
eukprot:CAMPEP_0115198288 /NCGR_PEP_ID=MMETSP0270-20121206/16027_1 /TAXON_ID=71861 /ORGANISM="Scrippsiella trochoidea, Strain CCMP3099" /LENGTH=36 /DNA_ID= /DNA_START= /DNA_END= /DNA_ORIENTATION=